jgi:hypothetical protein
VSELREASKLRSEDVSLSDQIYNFLDYTFYKTETSNFERVVDKDRQVKGIDVIFTYNGKEYKADEKAAVRYRNLTTYALELSFINRRNEVQEGWLVRDDLENDSYVFVWVDKNQFTGKESVTLAVVTKDKLKNHLESLGWSIANLKKKMSYIRDGKITNMGNLLTYGCKFTFSEKYVEKPINILLPRDVYMNIADVVWTSDL